jgi:hypothetical protein
MDLSKLPKLSQTPPSATVEPPPSASPDIHHDEPPERIGADVWLSAIIGLVFLLIGRRFAFYLFSMMTGAPFHTNVNWLSGPKAGQEVAYRELEGFVFYNESAMFLFGLTLLLEAIMLSAIHSRFAFTRPLIILALLIAVLATGYNLIVALMLFSTGVLPLFSLLAVAFGGYIVMHEWRLLQARSG